MHIAAKGNIASAARDLNVAPTALGVQIRNLEQELSVAVFQRHSRGLILTEAGRTLYERAATILALVEDTRRDMIALSGNGEPITIGITRSIMRLIGADLLVAAKLDLPGVRLEIFEDLSYGVINALARGDVDLALAYNVETPLDSTRKALMVEHFVFATAPGAFEEGPIDLTTILGSPLALASDHSNMWLTVHRAAAEANATVNLTFAVQSLETIKSLVARGTATSVLPFGVVAQDCAHGEIEVHEIATASLTRTLYFVEGPRAGSIRHRLPFLRLLDTHLALLADRLGRYATTTGRCE